jgi:dienelactone hydrolase
VLPPHVAKKLMKTSIKTLDALLLPMLSMLIAPSAGFAAEPLTSSVSELGIIANLYFPAELKGERLPAIIVLGGSEGGLGAGAAQDAHLIASHGYVVLQLAYFDAPGLPKELGLIPLEYFKTAIEWLRSQPNVDPHRVGIEGTSIGGEVALVVAAHYPEIKALVAAVPSSVVWPGISHTSTSPPSTFTLAGKPLSDLPYGWNGSATSIYDLYARGLTALPQHPEAIIPVERINGPLMLVCGEKDMIWPSCAMAEQVTSRLKANGFKYAVQLLKYADAGHAAFGPPEPQGSDKIQKLAALGGSAEGNQAARLDDWPKAMAFMDAALKPKTVDAKP